MKFAADSNDTNQSHIHEHCDSAANARTPPADSSDSTHVFISGTGVVCAAGRDLEESFATMLSGTRNPTDRPTLFESELNKPVFECPSDLELDDDLRSERTLALAAKALDEALNNANLAASELAGPRVGVVLGSTVACMLNSVDFYAEVRKGGMPDMAPLTKYVNGDISERIADMLSATGPRATIANACSSGANAVMTAFSWIRAGLCDIVIAGGADELSLIPYCGFNSLQIMGDAPCTPFDRGRKGLTLGEGAGILILETVASLERRGRDPKARLITCGCASDAYHLTGPHPEGRGLKRAVAQALKSAAVDAGRIDYVNAHGTATPDNDRVEANALFDIFGKRLRYSSTKYYTGHTLAAAGAIEAALCVAGLDKGLFPGTPVEKIDPDIPVQPSGETIRSEGDFALSTSMAFGGTCVALLFAGCDESAYTSRRSVGRPARGSQSHTEISITGLGVVGPFGRGLEDLRSAMTNEKSSDAQPTSRLSTPPEIFNAPMLKKLKRRADTISLMALAAAADAVKSANLADSEIRSLSVVFATSFGAHTATFAFLDSLLDFGEGAPSPTKFSNSVHNAPTFHITRELGIFGSSITMTAFKSSFEKALSYAESLLTSEGTDRVLLVAGDEVNQTMRRISNLWCAQRGHRPFEWGEGTVAFLLEKPNSAKAGSKRNHPQLTVTMTSAAKFADTAERTFGHTLFKNANALACALASERETSF